MTQDPDTIRDAVSRRTVLKTTAATGALVGAGGIVASQQSDVDIALGGETAGWIGRVPARIDGETNPTLQLEAGQEYTLRWENVDGAAHNFAILDAQGNSLVRTEIVTGNGTTQTVTFTASEEMAEYYCEVHPQSMRGQVQIGTGGGGGGNATTTGNQTGNQTQTDQPTTQQPADVDQRYVLGGRATGWEGMQPSSIEGQLNPPLEFEPGNTYEVKWINLDGFDHNIIIMNGDGDPSTADVGRSFVRTEIMSQQSAAQTVTFTAQEGMNEYYCEVHPALMRGAVNTGQGTPTPTETPEPDLEPTETFQLAFRDGNWVGVAPSSIEGQTNPTLNVQAGEAYAIEWTNYMTPPEPGRRPNMVLTEEYPAGPALLRSDFLQERCATQTVTFTATEDLSAYFSENHLEAQGDIQVSGGAGGGTGNGTGNASNGTGNMSNATGNTSNGTGNGTGNASSLGALATGAGFMGVFGYLFANSDGEADE